MGNQLCCQICTRQNLCLIKVNDNVSLCQTCAYILQQKKKDLCLQNLQVQKATYLKFSELSNFLQQESDKQSWVPQYYQNLANPFQDEIKQEDILNNEFGTVLEPVSYILNYSTECISELDNIKITPLFVPVIFSQIQQLNAHSFNQSIILENVNPEYQVYLQITAPDLQVKTYLVNKYENEYNINAIRFLLQSSCNGVFNIELFFLPKQESEQKIIYWNANILSISINIETYQLYEESQQLLQPNQIYYQQILETEEQLQMDDINCLCVVLQSQLTFKQILQRLKEIQVIIKKQKDISLFQAYSFQLNMIYLLQQWQNYDEITANVIEICQKVKILDDLCTFYVQTNDNIKQLLEQLDQQ